MTEDMQTTDQEQDFASVRVVVRGEHGLHARPAGKLAQRAQSFRSEIYLLAGENRADAKSILDVLTLAAGPGEVVQILARGEDAGEALDSLKTLFERNLED
ncbi:HPr family phosphocarrier protein [Pseudodesulfovibrio sp.]|uniref:HPr family phosphocarrier protein n=1 Tax=Pseudodesulfovibrio sp. TaxID=2035812 RepID=UPI00261FF087|nr:HPr family phosphocarrier protein [Pseudodesulfovibrio sp.]MDD3312906.1 HPr family phosphocarrier protein [Pseudodesulfovibrio sp.]